MKATTSQEHAFVVLEGIDIRGKTTVSRELAEVIGATLVKTPVSPVAEFRKVYDCCENYDARYLYYMSSLVLASVEITELLKSGPVVCDRWLHSAVLYHKALGVDTSMVNIERLHLAVPSLTVCLVCDASVAAERFRQRGENKDDNIEDNKGLLATVDRLMQESILAQVDTSFTTASEAALQIAAML